MFIGAHASYRWSQINIFSKLSSLRVIQVAGKDTDFWGWPVTVVNLKNDIECAKGGGVMNAGVRGSHRREECSIV